jgi:glycosyltransferase involved in cell wall biosynthesis
MDLKASHICVRIRFACGKMLQSNGACLSKLTIKLNFKIIKQLELRCNSKKLKFSIIIPIYNTGKYIQRCLSSCVNQTYPNIEILCIDDFSNNTSYEILESIQKTLEVSRKIITKQNTVSLHIRRGDYVTDIKTHNLLGLCSLDYYKKCVLRLEEELGDLNIFVFSDDTAWAKDNLIFDHPMYFVDHNDTRNFF